MTADAHDLLGIGLYAVPEAARILHVPGKKLRHWAYGQGGQRVIVPELGHLDGDEVLTFRDLIQLRFINCFRNTTPRVSMPKIRDAAEKAGRRFQTQFPFVVQRFRTDGRDIFAEMLHREGDHVTERLRNGQFVLPDVAEEFYRNVEIEGDEIVRLWPMGKDKHVVLDPERNLGKPIDVETGVPTLVLYRMSFSGETIEDIADWYDVHPDAVRQAIEYEKSILRVAA